MKLTVIDTDSFPRVLARIEQIVPVNYLWLLFLFYILKFDVHVKNILTIRSQRIEAFMHRNFILSEIFLPQLFRRRLSESILLLFVAFNLAESVSLLILFYCD